MAIPLDLHGLHVLQDWNVHSGRNRVSKRLAVIYQANKQCSDRQSVGFVLIFIRQESVLDGIYSSN